MLGKADHMATRLADEDLVGSIRGRSSRDDDLYAIKMRENIVKPVDIDIENDRARS